jgi:hypothetical protein
MLSKTGLIAFAVVGLKVVHAAALPSPGSATTGVSLGATSHWGTACPQGSAVSVGTSGDKYVFFAFLRPLSSCSSGFFYSILIFGYHSHLNANQI